MLSGLSRKRHQQAAGHLDHLNDARGDLGDAKNGVGRNNCCCAVPIHSVLRCTAYAVAPNRLTHAYRSDTKFRPRT